jgi:hypothetical protein
MVDVAVLCDGLVSTFFSKIIGAFSGLYYDSYELFSKYNGILLLRGLSKLLLRTGFSAVVFCTGNVFMVYLCLKLTVNN